MADGAAVALLLAIIMVLAWSRAMRARVATATAGLQAELAERHRVEAALRRSERELALHLDQTVVGVIEFDLKFRIAYWNAAADGSSAGRPPRRWAIRPTCFFLQTSASRYTWCGGTCWAGRAAGTTSTTT